VKNINLKLREYLSEIDENLILWNGFDDAVIGLGERCGLSVVAYSKDKIIHILMKRDKMTDEEALEYYEYNILNSYVGENTPITIELIEI
jgi:hypothetical protein